MRKSSFIIIILFFTSLIVNITSCKLEKGSNKAIVSFILGTPEVIAESGNKRILKVLDELKKNDTVETNAISHLTIQIGSDIIFKILPNTKAKINTLFAGGDRELLLENGTISSKISKLKKGSGYRIKTPTAVASVRGTVFSISHNPGRSVVSVGEGKVEVCRLQNNKESTKSEDKKVIEKDVSVVITDKLQSGPLTKIEKARLKSVSIVPLVEDIEKKSKEDLMEIEKGFSDEEKKVMQEFVEAKPMTLEQIKAKYNRIDLITLYTGKKIKGVIVSRGEIFNILTPNGIILVPKVKIRNTTVIK